MFGHYDEGINLKSAFAAVPIQRLEKKTDVVLDHKQSASLPGRESYEISSGRGDDSSRLQEQPSAAKAAIFAKPKPARVKLVPFPVNFVGRLPFSGMKYLNNDRYEFNGSENEC